MIILLTFCTVCGSLYPLAKNACLNCLLVEMVLKEILSTAASSATTLSNDSLVGLNSFQSCWCPRNFCLRFPKKLAVLPSLCREEFSVFRQRWFLIAPVDLPLQEIVFSQVSHFALSPFLDLRK